MRASQLFILTSLSFPILSSCGNSQPPYHPKLTQPNVTVLGNRSLMGQQATKVSNDMLPRLTAADKRKIGNKIWKNESGGKVSGLTAWNVGEEFPSLGIGHFIWYPKNYRGPFTESFPSFVRYAQQRGAKGLPLWVQKSPNCPWQTRASFLADINKPRLSLLRNFLAQNIDLQTDFIMHKSRSALQNMLIAAPAADRERIKANYAKVATTANGAYALIDYVNFKGEGINPKERYNGQGWGLLQVLQNMKNVGSGQAAAKEFSASAKRMLDRRISNSDKKRGESRWRAGWHNRCDTYARPL